MWRHQDLLHAAFDEALRRGAPAFSPQALSNLAWASAVAGVPAPSLLVAIEEHAAHAGLRER